MAHPPRLDHRTGLVSPYPHEAHPTFRAHRQELVQQNPMIACTATSDAVPPLEDDRRFFVIEDGHFATDLPDLALPCPEHTDDPLLSRGWGWAAVCVAAGAALLVAGLALMPW